ncbi:hypothetical protein BT93_E1532 [Corymbia citriodora subsp. variegata]|nr:hypothetical protein BT93_E1532 [Corymbia citriodora subsp. variegata]
MKQGKALVDRGKLSVSPLRFIFLNRERGKTRGYVRAINTMRLWSSPKQKPQCNLIRKSMARLGFYLCLVLIALAQTGSEACTPAREFGRSMVLVESPKTMVPDEFKAVGPQHVSPGGPDPQHHAIISRKLG